MKYVLQDEMAFLVTLQREMSIDRVGARSTQELEEWVLQLSKYYTFPV